MVASMQREAVQADDSPFELTVTFDPSKPLGQNFVFSTDPDNPVPVPRVLQITSATTIQLTLATADPDVTVEFASPAVAFTPPVVLTSPPHIDVTPTDTNQVEFTIPTPPHYFTPWLFVVSINVKEDGVPINGVVSPAFFVSLPSTSPAEGDVPAQQNVAIHYVPASGIFNIDSVFNLTGSDLLINTVYPVTVNFTLDGGPTFADQSVLWNGSPPPWATTPSINDDHSAISLTIDTSGEGEGAGFRFGTSIGEIPFASPDPILINGTLGDG